MATFTKTRFLTAFLRNSRSTGSVTPSSKYLVSKLLEGVNLGKSKVIIELGPGEGVFTRELLERMPQDCHLYTVEVNQKFVDRLGKIEDTRLTVIQDSALKLSEIVKQYNIQNTSLLLSSLPISNFSDDDRDKLLIECSALIGTQGTFLQYQYSKKNLKEIQRHFSFVHVSREWRNVPPAWCYTCKNQSNEGL